MGRFKLCLNDYQAIAQAELQLDGLTVLCGLNGCGKSTLLRWLYYIVRGLKYYKGQALAEYTEFLIDLLLFKYDLRTMLPKLPAEEVSDLPSQMGSYPDYVKTALHNLYKPPLAEDYEKRYRLNHNSPALLEEKHVPAFILEMTNLYCRADEDLREAVASADEIFQRYLTLYLSTLKKVIGLSPRKSNLPLQNLSYRLGAEFKPDDPELATKITSRLEQIITSAQKEAREQTLRSDPELFKRLIYNNYHETAALPENLKLFEFDKQIFDVRGSFGASSVKQVFYVDSPLTLGELNGFELSEYIWRRSLADSLKSNINLNFSHLTPAAALARKFQSVIRGRLNFKSKSPTDSGSKFAFTSDNGDTFALKYAATGLKAFACIESLLEYNLLDENSLLLLDEPEAYLHPQWIAYYAYLITQLHQELKVNVVLSSHSPDLVNCLYSFSTHAKLQDRTHFYLAEPKELTGAQNRAALQYEFHDQGEDLSEIYRTFNRSYDVIDLITETSQTFASLDTDEFRQIELPWQ